MGKIILFFLSSFYIYKINGVPPGTVHLKDNIYIDKEQITIVSWKEYVQVSEYYQKKAFYPDTSYMENGKNYYFTKSNNDKPIKKISLEAAKEYSKWRAEFINKTLQNYSKKSTCSGRFYVKNYKQRNFKLHYRIATEEEYNEALKLGIIKKTNTQEFFLNSKYNQLSTFRCVAEVVYD